MGYEGADCTLKESDATLRLAMQPSTIGSLQDGFSVFLKSTLLKSLSEIVPPCVKRCCKEEAEPKGGHMFRAKEGLDSQLENACGGYS